LTKAFNTEGVEVDNPIYIFGHKNPDTDSVCSAIAYAELKKKLGINAVPRVLGSINRETMFVLSQFGVEVPEYLHTVKTQLRDLSIDTVFPVSPDISVRTVWTIMKKNNFKTVPVVDENERLIGIASLSDITNKYMDVLDSNIIASTKTPLRNIVETLNARIVCGSPEDFRTSGKVVISAASPDELKDHIEPGDLVICGTRPDSQLKSIEAGASCIIVTCGGEISKEVLDAANKYKCIVLTTPSDTFATSRLINQSIPIGSIMTTRNIVKFNVDDFIDSIKGKMLETRYRSYPVVDSGSRVKGFVSRYHLISQRKKLVILVDHNEKSQSVDGIEDAQIVEIIDHHRLGDIQTVNPVFFKNEPLGSTSTIIANMYFGHGVMPSRSIAGILCAAIISDTMKFNSPTSTYTDRITAEKLSEIAGIDIDSFANQMFKEGSSLKGKLPEEIFYQDFKEFNLGSHKIGIGQVYTIDSESTELIKKPLIEFMEKLCRDKEYFLLMLLITDIPNKSSELLFTGSNTEIIARAFNADPAANSIRLPGIVSRKKQVIPAISAAIEKLGDR